MHGREDSSADARVRRRLGGASRRWPGPRPLRLFQRQSAERPYLLRHGPQTATKARISSRPARRGLHVPTNVDVEGHLPGPDVSHLIFRVRHASQAESTRLRGRGLLPLLFSRSSDWYVATGLSKSMVVGNIGGSAWTAIPRASASRRDNDSRPLPGTKSSVCLSVPQAANRESL